MGRYIKGKIDEDLSLGVLAGGAVVLTATPVVSERTLVSSIVCKYTLSDMTQGDNVGPILCGVAHSDYTATEIDEWIEQASASWAEADLVAGEIRNRKIRELGIFEFDVAGNVVSMAALNGGRPIKTKLNWILNAGQGLDFWCYNTGSAALSTTDPNLQLHGHANLWPR